MQYLVSKHIHVHFFIRIFNRYMLLFTQRMFTMKVTQANTTST